MPGFEGESHGSVMAMNLFTVRAEMLGRTDGG
jgi:hypothetical protein